MPGGRRKKAHIVAVNMGYGHERPAHVMRQFFGSENHVWIANDYPGIPTKDRRIWEDGRKTYERISRMKKVPVIGQAAFGVMDAMQRIPPFYPHRDLSRPSLQVRQFYLLIRRYKYMQHLIERIAEDPLPLVCTFMSPAFAAEEFNYPGDIFLLCTDSDVSRAWAPLEPKKSRIQYLAPSARVAERLALYGVKEENIHLTGFPLPHKVIGGPESKTVLKDLQRRICHLDPNGYFVSRTGKALEAFLGPQYCKAIANKKAKTIRLAFAIGGAGAQRELGVTILDSLANDLRAGNIMLDLIAGTRKEIKDQFEAEIKKRRLGSVMRRNHLNILYRRNRQDYFDAFTELMPKLDVLWTKPSELSFYTGLGIPIIMAPPVGSQEDFNREWLMQIGGGIDQMDPRYTNEWLFDWVESGALARMAWQGFIEAPTHGVYRIYDTVTDKPHRMHPLPMTI